MPSINHAKKSVRIKILRPISASALLHLPTDHHQQKDKPSKIYFANNSTTNHPIQKQTEGSESSQLVLSNSIFKKKLFNFFYPYYYYNPYHEYQKTDPSSTTQI